MSDTITNVEMDGFLSSIRRLVSDKVAQPDDEQQQEDDCFVLTPALRVELNVYDDEPVNAPEMDVEAPKSDIQNFDEPFELTHVLAPEVEDEPAEDVAVFRPGPEADDDISSGGTDEIDPLPDMFTAPEYQSMAEAWKRELAEVTRDTVDQETSESALPETEQPSLEDRIAELEMAVEQAHDEWEPDGSEPEASRRPKRHLFEVVANTSLDDKPDDTEKDDPEYISDVTASASDQLEDGLDDDPEDDLDDITPVFSHIDRPREAPFVLSQPLHAVPDAVTVPDDPSEDLSIDTPDDPTAKVSPSLTQFQPRKSGAVVDDDDVFLDVEALRSMIGDLVREEFHGKLGERITQNLRHMVRQEIERAITLKKLD